MYIACNPGSRRREVWKYLHLSDITIAAVARRLRRIGVIAGRLHYDFNSGLAGRAHLRHFLRALGEAYGMPVSTRRSRVECAEGKLAASMPRDLFDGERRTDVLALIAILRESYLEELGEKELNEHYARHYDG